MLFEIFSNSRFRVCAAVSDKAFSLECDAWSFLKEQNRSSPGQVAGMKSLLQQYSLKGRAGLSTDLLHHADNEKKILEFIKGQMRIFCFEDGNTLVLTHGALKKSGKADPSEVKRAVACRERYLEWKKGAF